MTASIPIDHLIRSVPFSQAEWDRTPSAVQAHLAALETTVTTLEAQLQQQVDQLHGRLDQTSSTSSKPPSSDSPFKPRKPRQSSGPRGGKTGHRGSGPKLLEPTDVEVVLPLSCSCGHAVVSAPTPYRTHQVLELPPIEMEVTHFILHQATCLDCGQRLSAQVSFALCGAVAQTLQRDRSCQRQSLGEAEFVTSSHLPSTGPIDLRGFGRGAHQLVPRSSAQSRLALLNIAPRHLICDRVLG